MSRKHIAILSLAAGIGLLSIEGRAGFFDAKWPVVRQAPAGEALIGFKDAALNRAAASRVWYTGAFDHLEFARFESGDLVMEIVYDTVIGDQSILDYHYGMETMLDTWRRNRGQAKRWGASKTVQAWHGKVDYQPYRLQASGRNCAGVNSEWDYSARDSRGRPMKVVFGYLCAKGGRPLAADRIEAILKGLTIDQRFGHTFVKPGQVSRVDSAAMAMAAGDSGTKTGNHEFPFEFGTQYTESGPSFGN